MLAEFESSDELIPAQHESLWRHVQDCDDCSETYHSFVIPSRWR